MFIRLGCFSKLSCEAASWQVSTNYYISEYCEHTFKHLRTCTKLIATDNCCSYSLDMSETDTTNLEITADYFTNEGTGEWTILLTHNCWIYFKL